VLNTAQTTTLLPVKDMNRARSFYEKTLGLKPLGFAADGNFMFACAGRSTIALIPKPQGTKAEHTALSFEVEDVVKEIKELKQRGVVFEDYDLPGFKTVEHVCVVGSDKAAWFKDPGATSFASMRPRAEPRALPADRAFAEMRARADMGTCEVS